MCAGVRLCYRCPITDTIEHKRFVADCLAKGLNILGNLIGGKELQPDRVNADLGNTLVHEGLRFLHGSLLFLRRIVSFLARVVIFIQVLNEIFCIGSFTFQRIRESQPALVEENEIVLTLHLG